MSKLFQVRTSERESLIQTQTCLTLKPMFFLPKHPSFCTLKRWSVPFVNDEEKDEKLIFQVLIRIQ